MKAVVLFTVSLLTFSLQARAEYLTMSCLSQTSPNRELTLLIVDQDIKQVRISINGSLPRAFLTNKIINQNTPGLTLYSIQAIGKPMKVENKVLEGLSGLVRISNDRFFCI